MSLENAEVVELQSSLASNLKELLRRTIQVGLYFRNVELSGGRVDITL